MNEIYDRYKTIRDSRNIKDSQVAKETGITKSTFSEWKSGKYTPKQDKLQKIADFFGVTIDYLMTGTEDTTKEYHQLNARDERDISRRLEQTLSDLEGQQGALMFDGAPLDDETKELLKASLEHSIRVAKINAKKFTNKRYLNSENQEK